MSALPAWSDSQAWQLALLGVAASLPVTALLNWLPNSGATVSAGAVIVGAMIAGALAANRATTPEAAGLRSGFLGGVVAVIEFAVTPGATETWSVFSVAFVGTAIVMVICFSSVFGVVLGHLGGWVANSTT